MNWIDNKLLDFYWKFTQVDEAIQYAHPAAIPPIIIILNADDSGYGLPISFPLMYPKTNRQESVNPSDQYKAFDAEDTII